MNYFYLCIVGFKACFAEWFRNSSFIDSYAMKWFVVFLVSIGFHDCSLDYCTYDPNHILCLAKTSKTHDFRVCCDREILLSSSFTLPQLGLEDAFKNYVRLVNQNGDFLRLFLYRRIRKVPKSGFFWKEFPRFYRPIAEVNFIVKFFCEIKRKTSQCQVYRRLALYKNQVLSPLFL